jgi:hypothetical protein
LVWFPAGRSIDVTFGTRNERVYAVATNAVSPRICFWDWDGVPPVGLEPRLNLLGIKPQ